MNNQKLITRMITIVLLLVNLFAISLVVSNWKASTNAAASQDNRKIVKKELGTLNEPLSFIDFKIKDKKVKLGEGFEDDAEWLKNLSFKIKNKSDKPITYSTVVFWIFWCESQSQAEYMLCLKSL